MLSDERLAEIREYINDDELCSRRDRIYISELLAELRSVRTREYREPRPEDDFKMVWLDDENQRWPVRLDYDAGSWYFNTGESNQPLKGRRICPVEAKPSPLA